MHGKMVALNAQIISMCRCIGRIYFHMFVEGIRLLRPVFIAFGRALLAQLHIKMLLLSFVPFLLSLLVWSVVLWLCFQPLVDVVQSYFVAHDGFRVSGGVLAMFGLGAIKTVIVPLIAMWALLPLMILTALVFIGIAAMPVIIKHVASRHYPQLEKRRGGTLWGSFWTAISSFFIFALLWIVTLPLCLIPPLTFVVQPALWGWLTYRVMAYDALADHASPDERQEILQMHRWPLFMIGAIAGIMGALPTLLWIGGALAVAFFPFLATGAIWLYVLVFLFSGLWFQYYCLDALAKYRAERMVAITDIA